MFVLLGEFSHKGTPDLANWLRKKHFGRMWGRDHVNRMHDGELWGIDNGAWSSYVNNKPFDGERFLKRLRVAIERTNSHSCIVAACPDIVCGGLDSLRFSMSWIDRLSSAYPQLPWHLVVQDGMDARSVKHVIHNFDGLFLGGSDDFKRQAKFWCDVARHHGKFFHWGRCRSINNVREAVAIGADSIDSTRPVMAWTHGERDRARKWLRVADGRDDQRVLF